MFFHVLTFAGSRGCCLNTRPIGRVLKHLPLFTKVFVFFVLFCFLCVFCFYFIKISKFALSGVILMYERTSKDRKKERGTGQVLMQ